jgi:hypothetical protein
MLQGFKGGSEENAVTSMWPNHVKQFANAAGIHMTHADFPKGHHTVMLPIADERGCLTSKTGDNGRSVASKRDSRPFAGKWRYCCISYQHG